MREHGQHVFNAGIGPRDQEKWWDTTNGGSMMCAGVGGPITGKGFDLGIIDDPVKNAEQADSQVYRDAAKDWYDSTWVTRREPHAAEIIIMTRWHEDDLAGYVLSKGDGWERLRLPAIAEDGDPFRQRGEALCPDRYPISELLKIKAETPPRWWSALYQQHPVAEEGAMFKRGYWQRYGTLPELGRGCITIDTSGWQKSDTSADYCAMSAWGHRAPNFYLADASRGHWEFPDAVRRAKDWQMRFKWPVVVEDTPWAKPLIQALKEEIAGVIAWPVAGRGSKENRARAVQHYAEGLNCYVPDKAEWASDWIEEHAAFPNGLHDDWVDTTVMALMYLPTHSPQSRVKMPGGYRVVGR
jgi:predicted phage terminase large subunit-like protein